MARPVDDANQMLFAYALYRSGIVTGAALWRKLVEEYGDDAKTERQVRRWIKHYVDLGDSILRLDDPFEWHRLDEYGLPWEASYDLLEVWATYKRTQPVIPAYPVNTPTVRQAIWWWRIFKAMPGDAYNMYDTLSVAGAFVEREIRHEVLGETLDLTDLEAWLALEPWVNWPDDPTSANKYLSLIKDGVVPALRTSSFEDSLRFYLGQGLTDTQARASYIAIRNFTWPDSNDPHPWLLPSQQEKLTTLIKAKKEATNG